MDAGRHRHFAEVVVLAVDAGGQRDIGEDVVSRDACAGRALGVEAVEPAGGLGFSDRVCSGAELGEGVSTRLSVVVLAETGLPPMSVPVSATETPAIPGSPACLTPSLLAESS